MIINMMRLTAFIGLSAFVALPVQAQPTNRPKPDLSEFAVLEKSAVFEIGSISGSLKETIQKGQELVWHRKDRPTRFDL